MAQVGAHRALGVGAQRPARGLRATRHGVVPKVSAAVLRRVAQGVNQHRYYAFGSVEYGPEIDSR